MNPYKVAKLINEKLSPELKKEIEGIKENSDNWNPDLYDIFEQNDKDLAKAAEKYLDSQSGWTPPQMKVAVIGSKDTMATAKKKIAATLPKAKVAKKKVMAKPAKETKKEAAQRHHAILKASAKETKYVYEDGITPLKIGERVEVKYTSGRYGETKTITGTLNAIDEWHGITVDKTYIASPFRFDFKTGKMVGETSNDTYDHAHTTYVRKLSGSQPKSAAPTAPITTSPTGRYRGIFGDYDNDGLKNVDDPNPERKGDKESVEEVKLSDEIAALIEYRDSQDEIRKEFVDMMAKKAKGEEEIQSRTKTPFSILNKLRRKRLVTKVKDDGTYEGGTQGLTDVIGAMIVFDTQAQLEKFKKQVKAGEFGKVVEFNDYYANDHAGYKAYHFGLVYKGAPIELQAKTTRMKKIGDANHELYKTGKTNADYLKALTDVMEQADAGDTAAANVIDPIIADPKLLNEYMSTRKLTAVPLGIAKLPENPLKYFKSGGAKYHKVPIAQIDSEKKNPPKSMITALLLMHRAAKGEVEKREPIKVRKVGERYVVVDGNATLAAAKYSGWETIVAELVDGSHPSKPTHANRKPENKEKFATKGAEGYLVSELTKAKRGDYMNLTRDQILEKAQAFEKARSKAAISRDEKGDSKKRISPTPENLVRWMNNPGGFDLIGVDTYKKGDSTANLKIETKVWWNRLGIKL